MKASEFIGMKVLDKETNEIGKVEEITIAFKQCLIEKIFISIGSALNRKYLVVVNDDIAEVGDYLQLNINKAEIEDQVKVDKIDDFIENGFKYKDFVGKTVLTQSGIEVGNVNDVMIDPKGCLVHEIVVTTGNALNRKYLKISDEDIQAIGDYVILKLNQEQIKDKIMD